MFETINDPGVDPCGVTDVPLTGDIGRATALTYWDGPDVFLSTGWEVLSTINGTGNLTANMRSEGVDSDADPAPTDDLNHRPVVVH